jgi:hypothetical protein
MRKYPDESDSVSWDENGSMAGSVADLEREVVGHRIVSVEDNVITLDNGKRVRLVEQYDCCAYTELESFLLHPGRVDHIITGVGTTNGFDTWHIYADMGDVLELTVGWSAGSGYYAYGFHIEVEEVN